MGLIANQQIENALKLESNASTTKPKLEKLQQLMKGASTIQNTPCAKWPKLPDRPGEQKSMRIRSSVEKKNEYLRIQEDCRKNKSQIVEVRKSIEGQQGNKISTAIASVFNSTIVIEQKYDEYILILNNSVNEVDQIITAIEAEPTVFPCGKFLSEKIIF